MVEEEQDYYEILGVTHESTIDQIKDQRNRLLLAFHPDHNKSSSATENTRLINMAWDTLSDPVKRRQYDKSLAERKFKPVPSAIKHQEPTKVRRRTGRRTIHEPYRASRGDPAGLEEEDYDTSVFYFPISNENSVTALAVSYILPRLTSHPSVPIKLFEVKDSQLVLHPIYRILYDVHQDFRTTVGLIHSIHLDNEILLLDGSTGNLIDQKIDAFLRNTPTLDRRPMGDSVRVARRGIFQLDQIIVQRAKQTIAVQHEHTVGYYGANNVHYTKTCTPEERSIFIRRCDRVLAPEWSISLSALARRYTFNALENPERLLFLENELSVCKICNERINDTQEMLMCNSCGNIVHREKSHGYSCRICNKSICRNCTYWIRRRKLFKTYLCEECAMEKQEHQVITRQLVSNQHKKFCRHCGAKMPVDALQCIKCQSTTVSQRSRSNTMTRYSNGLTQREISGPQKSGQTWNTVKKALKYTAMAILFVLSVIGLLSGRRRTRRLF